MTAEIIDFETKQKANSFKTDQGVFRLRALFYEETLADKSTVVYTLKDNDHAGYPSLRRLFLDLGDPTEYYFAQRYLDGWAHWERLCDCDWFRPYIERWRRELELIIRSQALMRIRMIASSPGKESFMANKFLLSGSWKMHNNTKIAKDEIKEEANKQEKHQVLQDAKRLLDVLGTNS